MLIVRPNPDRARDDPGDMPFLVEFPPVHLSYTDRPSDAWLRTPDQFVYLTTDRGIVGKDCIEMALALLEEISELPMQPEHEMVKLRAVCESFHNGITVYVDYFIDSRSKASMTKKELLGLMHHEENWYGGQYIKINARLHRDAMGTDSFLPLHDVYYDKNFTILGTW